jgi:GNAT superfamily N-acetyltransferase
MPFTAASTSSPRDGEVTIGPLGIEDLAAADRIVRLAFGTFLGLPESQMFEGDSDCVGTRWKANPSYSFAARSGPELIGSVFAANWGSVGFFGPLTVRPDFWNRGVGQQLLQPVMALFERWGTTHAGLYTFAQSPKHLALYQKFGFRPRFVTMIMVKPIGRPAALPPESSVFSEVEPGDRMQCLEDCRAVCDAIYEGLEVRDEIESVAAQTLGDTVLLHKGDRLEGLAVCHVGPGTEAGSGTCYVKFGAVRPGPTAGVALKRLLESCEALGSSRGATHLHTGVNSARHEAYEILRAEGFRINLQGVAMHRPNEPGYSRPGVYLLDDWR